MDCVSGDMLSLHNKEGITLGQVYDAALRVMRGWGSSEEWIEWGLSSVLRGRRGHVHRCEESCRVEAVHFHWKIRPLPEETSKS